jgi:hypothetical protein
MVALGTDIQAKESYLFRYSKRTKCLYSASFDAPDIAREGGMFHYRIRAHPLPRINNIKRPERHKHIRKDRQKRLLRMQA